MVILNGIHEIQKLHVNMYIALVKTSYKRQWLMYMYTEFFFFSILKILTNNLP